MLNRFTAVTAAMLVAAAGAMAQDAKKPAPKAPKQTEPAKSLKVGDKAPPLSIEKWVKGDKVDEFANGKVYVVEFWATWCGPCIQTIPHLSDLQKQYKDKGVTVVGVASSERGAGADTLSTLKKFAKEKKMEYTVAYDSDRSMSRFWMEPAGQNGIPCSFLVGKDGKIAFIGHPMNGLDEAVKKAVGGGKAAIDGLQPNIVLVGQPDKTDAKPAAKPAAKAVPKAAEPETTLYVGDKAPELTISKWVKGEPVTGFEKGKTYVVEFWATWCGPCKESIPHLTELQHANKNVRFIGVSVWESDQAKVEPFVKDMGEKMDYTVAMDEIPEATDGKPAKNASMSGKMAKNWLSAAGQSGIPASFIVNGEGKVAWIGHPSGLEKPLAQITAGKWDLAKEAATYRHDIEVKAKIRPLGIKIQAAVQTGDFDGALALIDEMIKLDPKSAAQFAPRKFLILLNEKKDYERAYAVANELVDGVCKDNSMALNQIAWTIVDPDGDVEKKDLKVAMKAAQRAFDITEGKDAAITDTLAKVYFDQGNITKALEYQEKAAKLAEGTQFEEEIKGRLEEFKKAAKNKGG